jgi:hypothetical protein
MSTEFRLGDGTVIETDSLIMRKMLHRDAVDLFKMDSDHRTHVYMGGTSLL